MTNGTIPPWLGRLFRLLPLVFVALCLACLAWLGFAVRQVTPRPKPLPAVRSLVVLIVPGLDASDWADVPAGQTSPLDDVVWSCPSAIAPVPAFLRGAPAQAVEPNARLQKACQLLLGENGALVREAKAGKSRIVALDDSLQTLTHVIGGDAKIVPDTWHVPDPNAAGGQSTDGRRFASAVLAALNDADKSPNPPSVLAVALVDDVIAADTYAPLCLPNAARKLRHDAVERAAYVFFRLTNHDNDEPTADAVLLVSPFSSAHQNGPAENERIGLMVLCSRKSVFKYSPLHLTSPSTRHTVGLATLDSVPPTLTVFLNPAKAAARSSRALFFKTNGIGTINHQLARWTNQWRELRFLVVVPWILAGLLCAAVWAQAKNKPRLFAGCALFAVAMPPALWLAAAVPLSTAGVNGNGVFLYANAALLALLVAIAGAWLPRFFALLLQFVAAVAVLLLATDLMSPGWLLMRSPFSYSVLEGARFYGIGNEASGVFLGASLAWAALLSQRRANFVARLLTGLGIVAVLGLPTLGADAGGAAAALAAWGTLLALSVAKPRRKIAAACAALCAVLLLAGLVVWEARRPASEQTHLGQVVAQTRAGNKAEGAAAIARRKIAVNARLSVTSPWAVLLATEIGLCVYLWHVAKKRGGLPEATRSGAIALFVGAFAAFVANDSGVVMAATVLLFGPPFLLVSNEVAQTK